MQLGQNTGVNLEATHPILTWMPRHAGWSWIRFHARRSDHGLTACERLRHARYFRPIL